ncbi:hypothetical protein SAMN05444274_11721 [Mariniphaga anaerophila]|uniref:Peptidase family M23 n=1 Tax=Mariniphaga anaerophila TaxID=1484053 RepID=A0A1M5G5Y8_9BACT|nr:hypothetical protein [Mariniphaga anaerophila]SHF99074.1 hypothetical protein SAMN05444274_11721 [Mariniphaga anaerophila]
MKQKIAIFFFLVSLFFQGKAQQSDAADFRWGNGFYYNLSIGESIVFNGVEVELVDVKNHYNQLRIENDTLWMKVARRSVPFSLKNLRIFVADNSTVSSLSPDSLVHGLLTKNALVCVSDSRIPLLDPNQFSFPVSFNDGFLWGVEEESYPFSFYKTEGNEKHPRYFNYEGIGFDLHKTRGQKKHWLVAIEESRVVWVESKGLDETGNRAAVLLESESQPGIYYYYSGLYSRNIAVKKGQKLLRGDAVGTAWGDEVWGHFQFSVLNPTTEPTLNDCSHYVVNCFPQLFGLYFQQSGIQSRSFTRGRITFGQPRRANGNQKNNMAFENFSGKGWVLGNWNPADKVEWVSNDNNGNVRLKKVLFEGTPAQCENPENYFEYQLTVPIGTYRIRAKVGDLFLSTSQKIEFEGTAPVVKLLEAGEYDWTGERIVSVKDGTLNIRIFVEKGNVAGISEIVFQRTY